MDKKSIPIRPPWIVAHRGASCEAPENTLAAFRLAVGSNVDGIEFDVQLSKDRVVVVHHDRTFQRILGLKRRVGDLTYDELSHFQRRSQKGKRVGNAHIPHLDEVLAELTGKIRLFIEIKSWRRDQSQGISRLLTTQVLRRIRQSVPDNLLASVYVLSFDRAVLDFARQLEPKWQYILNHRSLDPKGDQRKRDFDFLWGHGVRIARLTDTWVRQKHALGQAVMTWACNGPRQLNKAYRLGADVILTDRPGWLISSHREGSHGIP